MDEINAEAESRADLSRMLREFLDHRLGPDDLRTRLRILKEEPLSDNLLTQVHVLEELTDQVVAGQRDDDELKTLAANLTAPGPD